MDVMNDPVTPPITYKGGYKYQLRKDYTVETGIVPEQPYDRPDHYMRLDLDGTLTVRKGYAWDGPSGCLMDTRFNMRASLVHDAFYQLLREEALHQGQKDATDRLFRTMCIEDGVFPPFAHVYYLLLKAFGKYASDPANKRPERTAPRANV